MLMEHDLQSTFFLEHPHRDGGLFMTFSMFSCLSLFAATILFTNIFLWHETSRL